MTRSPLPYALLAALALAACGPTQATQLAFETENMLEAAEVAGAEEKAPYEYFSAKEYLHKSKEEVGHADFENAVEMGVKALEFAKKAKQKALEESGAAAPAPPPSETPDQPAPKIVPIDPEQPATP